MYLLKFTQIALTALIAFAPIAIGQKLTLKLPTDNDALFRNQPEKFYMYCDRTFEGKVSKPWTAGKYGYVRNMKRSPMGVIGTRLHEGIDIQAVKRDRRQEPLDLVRPIAPGKVVYVNASSGRSNYGKYVVIEHTLPEGQFFSLYAHFNRIDCKAGDIVTTSTTIGKLGYTGRGTTRTRAHLHLEFGMMCSAHYNDYLKSVGGGVNYHGNHNGLNLIGCDVSSLLTASHQQGSITFAEEIAKEEPYFKVTVPRKGKLELIERNPFLIPSQSVPQSPSWELTFTAAGFPLKVLPSRREVKGPTVTWVKPQNCQHSDRTLARLSGVGSSATLTARGLRFIKLLTEDFPISPTAN